MYLNNFCNRKAAVRLLLCTQLTKTAGKSEPPNRFNTQLLRVMRLTAILLLAGCLQVAARGHSQTVTYSATNAPLSAVFTAIEQQTGFTILADKEQLNKSMPVTVSAFNMQLPDFLAAIFANQNISYSIEAKTIFLSPKISKPAFSQLTNQVPPITGIVKDSSGIPLAGATVTHKISKTSVQTNFKGEFTLDANEGDELLITYIGFNPKRIIVKGSYLLAVLAPFNSPLDEVQIQAYGKTTRRLNTGNITTIKGEEIAKQPVGNPLLAMVGRVPNLVITPSSGLPNGAVDIQLRGQNSLAGSSLRSEPLIIIDGVPYQNNLSAGSLGSFGSIKERLSTLSFLNVNDIEAIDVLADADATSIYGSRGGNGVILITTKKGKVGETQINLSLNTGISQVTKKLDLLSTTQYLQMRKEAYQNNGELVPNKQSIDKNYSNFDLTLWDQNRYTDWQEMFLGRTATSYAANLSISGGSPSIQYLIAGNFNTQDYIFPGDNKFQAGSTSFNLNGTSNNTRFRAMITGSYSFNNSNSSTSDLTSRAVSLSPNAPAIYTDDGALNWEPNPDNINGTATWVNPFALLLRTSESNNSNLRGSTELSYKISDRMVLKAFTGYSEIRTRTLSLEPIASKDPSIITSTGKSSLTTLLNRSFTFDPQIIYNAMIGNGSLDALVGFSYQSQSTLNETISGQGYTSDALLRHIGSAGILFSENNSAEYKYAAIFGRLTYNWRNKYLLNVTSRRDGSSRFGPGYQFGTFWSTGLAWIFSEEELLKEKLSFMTFGKLRASYGTNGNDGIGDYQYLELYEGMNDVIYQNIRPIRSRGVTNPDYHWESVRKIELALETGFLNDRLLLSTSYWRTRSSDQLGLISLPATAGAETIAANQNAAIQNSGWDFIVNTKNVVSNRFKWSSTATFGVQYNKLLARPEGLYNGYGLSKFVSVGQPFTGFAVIYLSKGVNSSTGLYQFVDQDGSVSTNKDNFFVEAARVTTRPLTLGVSNSFTYRNFDLSFFFQFTKQMGRNYLYDFAFIRNITGTFSSEPDQEFGNLPVEWLSNWKSPGDVGHLQKFTSNNNDENARLLLQKARDSDLGWVDASFIRIKNVSLSYTLPERLIKKGHISTCRIFVQAQNLFTITDYRGLDPEIQTAASLPQLRVVNAGLQIGL